MGQTFGRCIRDEAEGPSVPPPIPPPPMGSLDESAVQDLQNFIHASVHGNSAGNKHLPFCSVLVLRHGKKVFDFSTGSAREDSAMSFGRDTICRFFSMTKTITSVAILQLMEHGLLSLDDPLSKHVPE